MSVEREYLEGLRYEDKFELKLQETCPECGYIMEGWFCKNCGYTTPRRDA